MAPDADKLRHRKGGGGDNVVSTSSAMEASDETMSTNRNALKAKLGNTEVCIDGSIYDVTSFDHPGGEVIQMFGGNDVTAQYKMIHPHHTSKHLEKMKLVGKLADYKPEYKFDTPFERELKEEVFKIVRRGREFGTFGWFFRAFVYLAMYAGLQYLWLTRGTSWQLAVVYGLIHSAIGMNVQHDANHGACSKRPWVNDVFGCGADLIGGNKWLWMLQHWTHHAYTNHPDKDPDAFGAEPFLLFHAYPVGHPKRSWIHAFQAFFYLPVLSGYWLSSVFNAEVLDLRQRGAQGVGLSMENAFIVSRRKYALLFRLYYIAVHVVAPFFVAQAHAAQHWTTTLSHILLLGASASLGLAVLFSLSHNFIEANRNPTNVLTDKVDPASVKTKKEQDGPVCWYAKQVETSCTYGGFWSGCLTGGLNFQVEHHLFPRMSSAWYPYIAPTVRKVCQKHGVNYVYFPWVYQNLWSTLQYVHSAGTGSKAWMAANPFSGKL